MARFIQAEANKGSQKWIQKLINEKTELLNSQIRTNLGITEKDDIQWLSPLKEDNYAEYRDEACLDLFKIKLEAFPLKGFWPKNGPQWDALGKSTSGKLFLVEAKSHIPELISTLKASNKPHQIKYLVALSKQENVLRQKLILTGPKHSINMQIDQPC